jgi:hypothetical protein
MRGEIRNSHGERPLQHAAIEHEVRLAIAGADQRRAPRGDVPGEPQLRGGAREPAVALAAVHLDERAAGDVAALEPEVGEHRERRVIVAVARHGLE